jgi:hypothetical protein
MTNAQLGFIETAANHYCLRETAVRKWFDATQPDHTVLPSREEIFSFLFGETT